MNQPEANSMVQDGIVNRALYGTQTPSGHDWTLIGLNASSKNRYPELYYILPTAPDLPPLLANSLAGSTPPGIFG
jgi:hypothetical protein